ncbi:MAG: response regulator transcription factor [Gammaproteobacteria bacterium]|nr:MAG: response regulator transcription factor [Gammaproteobacteria bacterium]
MPRRILVVEDNRDIAHLLQLHLKDLGCEIELAHDGNTGLQRALSNSYDLIILDLMLPGVEGIDICRRMRVSDDYTPILMLTAKSSELDRVVGLETGADDYLTKPFSIRELLARVKALFRRIDALTSVSAAPDNNVIHAGDLVIDVAKHEVSLGDERVELTAKEFDLLVQFARNPGRVYTRSQLLDLVWGYGHEGYEHTVNSHINRLRAKIEQNRARPRYILTVWGVGYKFFEASKHTKR